MRLLLHVLIILSISINTLEASYKVNECQTDIWFGNGVWNTEDTAEDNNKAVKDKILYH